MTPVTDPEILKQLEGQAPAPVTDPKLLRQLEEEAPPKERAELRAYDPTIRDRVATFLMDLFSGEERASPQVERFVQGLTGSRGIGTTNPSIADISPAGPVFAGDEMQRAAEAGKPLETAVNALGVIPAAGPAVKAGVEAVRSTVPAAKALPRFGAETRAVRQVQQAAKGDVESGLKSGDYLIDDTGRIVENLDREGSRGPALGKMAPRKAPAEPTPSVTPEQVAQFAEDRMTKARLSGQDLRLMDLGGAATRNLTRTAANLSPEGRNAIDAIVNPRFESQSARAESWLRTALGMPGNASKTLEALREASRAPTTAAYKQAFVDGSKGIWNDALEELTAADAVKAAMRYADTKVRNMSAVGRETPPTSPFSRVTVTTERDVGPLRSVSPAAREALQERTTETVVRPPTLEFWDYTKRNLDDQIGKLQRAGANSEAADVTALRARLVQELDAAVPSYKRARGVAAEFFQASDAVHAGEQIYRGKWTAHEIDEAMRKMSANEAHMVREGFLSEMLRDLKYTRDRNDLVKRLLASPGERDKMAAVMGSAKAREFEAMLHVEEIMQQTKEALGNSTTARQLIDVSRFGGASAALPIIAGTAGLALHSTPAGLLLAGLTWGAKRAHSAAQERVAAKVAELLTSDDPAIFLRGVRQVANAPHLLDSLRAFNREVLAVAGGRSATIEALSDEPDAESDREPTDSASNLQRDAAQHPGSPMNAN
jgi:hypothetical protein